MSREIKFRAWSNEHNRYCDFATLDEIGRWVGWIKSNGVYLTTTDIVLEQDTGIEDKNGKRICEGDIVNVIGTGIAQVIDSPTGEWMLYYRREPDEINNGFVSVIPKNKPSGLWKTNTTSYIEVIGNIHENPELLGVENE